MLLILICWMVIMLMNFLLLSNSDNGISITVGGTTKSVSNISVNYASSAGNADTVDGYHASSGNNKPWGTIPVITT